MLVLEREQFESCMDYLLQFHPKSLPIYYLLYGICKKDGAWDEIEFVVDQWPNPAAIVCRPKPGEKKNLDTGRDPTVRQICYTVTVWSRDTSALEQLLSEQNILVWENEIMFHGVACPGDRIAVEQVCQRKGILDTHKTDCENDCCNVVELRPETLRPCSLELPEGFSIGSLRPYHAAQINREWTYGGNESTRLYLEYVLDPEKFAYPSAAVLDETGKAVSYILYEPEGNMAMGFTNPAHRGKGFFRMVSYVLAKTLFDLGRPNTYVQISSSNVASKSTFLGLGGKLIPDWKQHWILYLGGKDRPWPNYSPLRFNYENENVCS